MDDNIFKFQHYTEFKLRDIWDYSYHKNPQVNDLLNIDFSNITYQEYTLFIDEKIENFFENKYNYQYDCNEYHNIKNIFDIIHHVINNNIYSQEKDIQNWYFALTLKILNFCTTKHFKDSFSVFHANVTELLKPLLTTLSIEKINYYNPEEQYSILKTLLTNISCFQFLDIFLDAGLEIVDIEGINPYYYCLQNNKSHQDNEYIIRTLLRKNIALPTHCWSYVFNSIATKKINENNDLLLEIAPPSFIINHLNTFNHPCVWNIILKHNAYQLVRHIPSNFCKPYTYENTSLLKYATTHSNFHTDFTNYYLFKNFVLNAAQDSDDLKKFLSHLLSKKLEKPVFDLLSEDNSIHILMNTIQKENKTNHPQYDYINNISKALVLYQKILIDKKTQLLTMPEDDLMKNSIDCINQYLEGHKPHSILDESVFSFFITQTSELQLHAFFDYLVKKYNEYAVTFYLVDLDNIKKLKSQNKQYNEQESDLIQLLSLSETITQQAITIKEELNNTKETSDKDTQTTEDINENLNTIRFPLYNESDLNSFKKEHHQTTNDTISKFLKDFSTKIPKNKILSSSSYLLEKISFLYETFPHFSEVIQHIENIMILQNKGDKTFYIPPLLLGGGPGVGKTFFTHSLSQLVNTHFEMLNMESMTANWILTGSSSSWQDATPGKIFKILTNPDIPSMNPIFLLDEIDKTKESKYAPIDSLLPLLERYTAKTFKDECIPLPIDASHIIWIATANDIQRLSAPIKSRFDIFTIPSPNKEQKRSLIKGIYTATINNNSWGQYFDKDLSNDTIDSFSTLMSAGAARDLRKSITLACSKAIGENSTTILPKHIENIPKNQPMPWDISK